MSAAPRGTAAGAPVTVAIQGEAGAFSHVAAVQQFGAGVTLRPCADFDELLRRVGAGEADAGAVPVENTLTGSVLDNFDRLLAHGLPVVAETFVRIRLCLVVRPGTRLEDVRRVASHPVALAQCRRYFAARPAWTPVQAYDTAGSVRDLMAGTVSADAVVASDAAAALYGARVLAAAIEDHAANYTRFLFVAREPAPPPVPAKASLAFTVAHVPGALHAALGVFARRGLNLTRIESRPLTGRPWQYRFYVDVIAAGAAAIEEATRELGAGASSCHVLGVYAATEPPTP